MTTQRITVTAVIFVAIILVIMYIGFFSAPGGSTGKQQFTVSQNDANTAQIAANLRAQGLIKSEWALNIALRLRGLSGTITPGGYNISKSMNTWEIAGVLLNRPALIWITIPEGLRKEEIADVLAKNLEWSAEQEKEWITKDTTTNPNYIEGVYFPDTYLIPAEESPLQVAKRLQAHFEEKFAPYATEAAKENIKWTTALTLASIIQREAAGTNDASIISGVLWNRLLASPPMKLQIDSTVQYARGDTGSGWWAPIAPSDENIKSPYNTYLYTGLPPHPISNPGLDAISAALNPATTKCLYYIHDSTRNIHCAVTYQEQQLNIQKYLR